MRFNNVLSISSRCFVYFCKIVFESNNEFKSEDKILEHGASFPYHVKWNSRGMPQWLIVMLSKSAKRRVRRDRVAWQKLH